MRGRSLKGKHKSASFVVKPPQLGGWRNGTWSPPPLPLPSRSIFLAWTLTAPRGASPIPCRAGSHHCRRARPKALALGAPVSLPSSNFSRKNHSLPLTELPPCWLAARPRSRSPQCPCKAARTSKQQPQRGEGICSKCRFSFFPARAFIASHVAAMHGKVSLSRLLANRPWD